MDKAQWIDDLFASLASETGLVGDALKFAQGAYDRNRWSRHWFDCMCSTSSTADFWRFSVLLRKIVDFRLEYWAADSGAYAPLWRKFGPLLKVKLKNRIKKWKDERGKTLLGHKVPDARYLQG